MKAVATDVDLELARANVATASAAWWWAGPTAAPVMAPWLVKEGIDLDQWALVCIAWEMLSGYSPFVAKGVGAIFYRLVNTEPH